MLRDFADVRLLHDKLKGAHILVTASARGGAEEALCTLCARMAGPSVHAALDVEEAPEGANLFVARGGQAGVAEALRRGGPPVRAGHPARAGHAARAGIGCGGGRRGGLRPSACAVRTVE